MNQRSKNIYDSEWEESKVLQLMSYKDIIQNKLEKVVQLNEEITDDAEFEEDMEKAMETEVKLSYELAILNKPNPWK